MTAKEAKYTIEITAAECYEIAYSIYRALTHAVETHWVNHLDVDWKEREAESIKRMKMFFELGLYSCVFDSYMSQLTKIVDDAKSAKTKKA